MSLFRYMRLIIFFDLPVETALERKAYRKFRKNLIDEGFLMLQQSVYSKLLLNSTGVNLLCAKINKFKPEKGIVQMLVITEKQFAGMETLVGDFSSNTLDTTERLIIL